MDYTEDYDFYQRYMLEDEYVLWKGKPEKSILFTGSDIAVGIFSILWLSFTVFWEMAIIESNAPLFAVVWGLPFVGIGLYMFFGRFLSAPFRRKKTIYVITNKKIIIKRGNKMEIHDGKELPPMEITIHKNGNGTITFSEEVYVGHGRRRSRYFMLENIADIAQAQNAVSMIER